MVISFNVLIHCFTLMDFWTLNQLLHSYNKSHLVMVHNSFYMKLNLVCELFVEDFCIQDEG